MTTFLGRLEIGQARKADERAQQVANTVAQLTASHRHVGEQLVVKAREEYERNFRAETTK